MLHKTLPNYLPEVNSDDDYAFLLRDLKDARAQLASVRKELERIRAEKKNADFDYFIQRSKKENLERENTKLRNQIAWLSHQNAELQGENGQQTQEIGNLRSLDAVKQVLERRRQRTYYPPPANN